MKRTIQKVLLNASVKVLDEEQMIIDHCISDDQPDRVNDDIALDGWVLDNFLANPVVLDVHNYDAPPVGKALDVYTDGNQLRAKTQFAPTERGKMYFQLYKDGFMRAFSVGFLALEYERNGDKGYHYTKQELLEYSVVPVPCNPRALKGVDPVNKIGATISKANRDLLEEAITTLTEMSAAVTEQANAVVAVLQQVLGDAEDGDPSPDAPGDDAGDAPNPTDPADDADKMIQDLKSIFGL